MANRNTATTANSAQTTTLARPAVGHPDGSAALYRDGTLYDTATGDVLATIGESLGGTTHLTDGIAYQADHGQDRSIVLLPGG